MVVAKTDGDSVWRWVQGALILVVAGFFLYGLRDLLNPFILYWVLIALLAPMRGTRGHPLVVTIATVLALLWVLDTTGSLLAPFILAFVLAYILDPVVDRLSASPRISRSLAIFLILIPAFGAVVVLVAVGLPALAGQLSDLIEQAPILIDRVENWIAVFAQMRPPE